jgi:hypothetical protein
MSLRNELCYGGECRPKVCVCDEVEARDQALQRIRDIVYTPTKATNHKSAERHFMADFDAIRALVAPFVGGSR